STYVKSLGFKDAKDAEGETAMVGVTNGFGKQTVIKGTIVGVLKPGIIDAGGVTVNRSFNQAVYAFQTEGVPPQVRQQFQMVTARFDVNMASEELVKLKEEIKKKGYDGQTFEDRIGTFKQVVDGIIMALNLFGAIALLAASFGIINTLLMAVQERTKEIGLMKAMGMRGQRIFLLFTGEAVMLGFWGSLLGVLAAIGIGNVINHVAITSFLKGLVGLELLSFPLQSVAGIMAIVIGIAFLAGTLPALRAARQNPIDSLRYE
ncbi:MAG TPA: FtsX-like permease family protein, partial [Candidatus Saccharimonadia bacterium]